MLSGGGASQTRVFRSPQQSGERVHGRRQAAGSDHLLAGCVAPRPNYVEAHSNLLFCLTYDPGIDSASLLAEHRRWESVLGGRASWLNPEAQPAAGHDRNPERRLRVGYVSPDLRRHVVARFLEPILAHHDPAQVEVICYAEVPVADVMTARLQRHVHAWRSIYGLTDGQLADLVRADGVDILVDLAGHTGNNRLGAFVRKPAPVQVTYLGYPNTTGLSAIDYCVTDSVADPPGEPVQHSEELMRLPGCFCCYAPPEDVPPVVPLPATKTGRLTFGSLHNLAKINAKVLDLWSDVLLASLRPGCSCFGIH